MIKTFKNINLNNFYFLIFIITSFVAEYKFFTSSFLSYLLVIFYIFFNIKKITLNKKQYLFFLGFSFYLFIIIFYSSDLIILFKNVKFWFGFTLVYIFFKCFKDNFNYLFFFRFCCLIIIIEAILINTIIDQDILYLRPTIATFFGFYQRPPSICGTPTISAVFIVLYFYFLQLTLKKISFIDLSIFLIALFCLFSMTGFILAYFLIILYFFNKDNKNITYWNFFTSFTIISITGLLVLFFLEKIFYEEHFNFQKLTLSYFYYTVVDHFSSLSKIFQIRNSYLEAIIGIQIKQLHTSGDNAYSVFFLQNGIIGILMFFSFFASSLKFTKNELTKFLIIFLSCFHYYSLGNILVQIIVAKILTQNQRD